MTIISTTVGENPVEEMVLIRLNCAALSRDLMGCGGNLLYAITVSWASLVAQSVKNLPAM